MVRAKFREETEKAHISANGKTVELEKFINEGEGGGQLVRSASYGGPFMPQTFKRPRPRPVQSRRQQWAASSKSSFRSGSSVPGRRPGRRGAVQAPSLLATAPVLYAQRPEERKSMASNGTGHEWKPYEHQDNLLWCKMMRDFDMIPDYEEFGVKSDELKKCVEGRTYTRKSFTGAVHTPAWFYNIRNGAVVNRNVIAGMARKVEEMEVYGYHSNGNLQCAAETII